MRLPSICYAFPSKSRAPIALEGKLDLSGAFRLWICCTCMLPMAPVVNSSLLDRFTQAVLSLSTHHQYHSPSPPSASSQ